MKTKKQTLQDALNEIMRIEREQQSIFEIKERIQGTRHPTPIKNEIIAFLDLMTKKRAEYTEKIRKMKIIGKIGDSENEDDED